MTTLRPIDLGITESTVPIPLTIDKLSSNPIDLVVQIQRPDP